MPPPTIIDFDSSSDSRFRDVYGRHHHQAVPRSGNLIQKTYHHVSGSQANVSAMEVVSLDASETAQFDLLLRKSNAPIASANVTSANIATWSADSLLSLRHGTTAIRSANVTVGNLSVGANCTAKLDNCIVRSFQRTLSATALSTTEICTIDAEIFHGVYTAELNVIQSESAQRLARVYKFNVFYDATSNQWRRLVPINQVLDAGNNRWIVEIKVWVDTTTLRLIRLGGESENNFECVLTVYQTRDKPVTIAPSNVTGTGTLATVLYSETLITQLDGRAGFGIDQPTAGYALTVGGAMLVDGTTTTANVHDIEIRGTVSGNGVTSIVSPGSNALITSGGVHSFVSSGYTTGNLTVNDKLTTTTLCATGGPYLAHNMILPQGLHVNATVNQGRAEFVNKRGGGGSGGFFFYEHLGGGTATPIDDSTRMAHFNSSGMDVKKDVSAAQSQGVLSSTAGYQFYYRQLAQPCMWRGTTVSTAQNTGNFAIFSFTYDLGTSGPYTSDLTSVVIEVTNGDFAANPLYFPVSAAVSEYTAGQIRKVQIFYHCNNDNLCRTNVVIFFTPNSVV